MQVPPSTPTPRAPASPVAARIDDVVERWRAEHDVPAVFASVRHAGAPIADVARGVTELGGTDPVTPGDRFWAGSITKPLVAAALLRLDQRGVLSLDDPVARWVPEYPHAAQTTVRQLLDQTSGIPVTDDGRTDPEFARLTADPTTPAWDDGARLAFTADADRRLRVRAPGEAHEYSNGNYVVAGEVLARATGRTVAQALDAEVAAPLGLSRDDLHLDGPAAPTPTRVHPHFRDAKTPISSWQELFGPGQFYRSVFGAAGGVISTASALASAGEAILSPRDGRLFTSASHGQQRDALHAGAAAGHGYGLGMYEDTVPTERGDVGFVGHNGSLNATQSLLAYVPSHDTTVAIMASATTPDADLRALAGAILDARPGPGH